MVAYDNFPGDGLFLVLKLANGVLDTRGRVSGSYSHHVPPGRAYNTVGSAKSQATRYRNQGFEAGVAEVVVVDGVPMIRWVET
jgi:hypothetical protein